MCVLKERALELDGDRFWQKLDTSLTSKSNSLFKIKRTILRTENENLKDLFFPFSTLRTSSNNCNDDGKCVVHSKCLFTCLMCFREIGSITTETSVSAASRGFIVGIENASLVCVYDVITVIFIS